MKPWGRLEQSSWLLTKELFTLIHNFHLWPRKVDEELEELSSLDLILLLWWEAHEKHINTFQWATHFPRVSRWPMDSPSSHLASNGPRLLLPSLYHCLESRLGTSEEKNDTHTADWVVLWIVFLILNTRKLEPRDATEWLRQISVSQKEFSRGVQRDLGGTMVNQGQQQGLGPCYSGECSPL